jgi:inward rectifier potassium channel
MNAPGRIPRPMKVRDSAFDLHKTGISRFDLRDPYHFAVTLSWPAFIAGAFGALTGLNAIFALLYAWQPGAVQNLRGGDLLRAFFFSLETLATVGYGEMAPDSVYGHVVAGVEIVIGMAFTAIFTGLLFVRFSKPRPKILFADKAVVTPHNGIPTLMVRIANGRLTMLTHAKAKLAMLVLEVSTEGQAFRRIVDLKLERDALPIFPLTWTLMHAIDGTSPLSGYGPDELKQHEIRIFVTVEALDAALGALVQDIGAFEHDKVAFGVRYADAVSFEDGRVTADLGRLSLIE